ncbi:hypothetical protein [Actinoplanes sp. NPDC023714]|uniref:hypothetical protein n=1 Tax=Actinoplanes sp. NPDC023714 TaxID=3154322 RepID=UPI0034041C8F
MSDLAQPRIWSKIDIPKTIAGTLAAVSAAVVGSFLGLAGTVIGAAVASLISSIATEVYHRYLEHGTKKLQATFVTAPAAVGTPDVPATDEPPSGEPARPIRWKRVALVAGALFVLGLGTLTAVELMTGKSAADATRGGDSGSPTLFQLSGNGGDSSGESGKTEDEKTPAPATSAEEEQQRETSEEMPETSTPTAPAEEGTETAAPEAPAETQQPTGGDSTSGEDTGSGDTTTGGGDTGGSEIQGGTE